MSRIKQIDQRNLWGASADTAGLEPQRTDLWVVDLSSVVRGLKGNSFVTFLPQFVRSVSLPDVKMKADVVRRDSVPFNMPSWDEPLDATKIAFLVDTSATEGESSVLALLDAWQSAARAGRGSRSGLSRSQAGTLNDRFSCEYAFNVRISLLRGSSQAASGNVDEQIVVANQQVLEQARLESAPVNPYSSGTDVEARANEARLKAWMTSERIAQQTTSLRNAFFSSSSSDGGALEVASEWVFKDMWLSGYKLSDLSYTNSKLMLAEATLYAESFELQ